MVSGINCRGVQSPPPTTLPARALHRPTPCLRQARWRKERVPVRLADQFRTRLAARVRIASPKGVGLAVAPDPALVVVALVGGHVDDHARPPHPADTVEQVHRSHHVGGIGFQRVFARVQHDRLRRHVQDDVGGEGFQALHHAIRIAHVADGRLDELADTCQRVEIGPGRRLEGIARDARPERRQQQAQPASLKTGVAGDEHPPVLPEPRLHERPPSPPRVRAGALAPGATSKTSFRAWNASA